MAEKIKFTFIGRDGELLKGFLNGIPARDLTESDWARMSDMERMSVEKSGLYQAPVEAEAVEAEGE